MVCLMDLRYEDTCFCKEERDLIKQFDPKFETPDDVCDNLTTRKKKAEKSFYSPENAENRRKPKNERERNQKKKCDDFQGEWIRNWLGLNKCFCEPSESYWSVMSMKSRCLTQEEYDSEQTKLKAERKKWETALCIVMEGTLQDKNGEPTCICGKNTRATGVHRLGHTSCYAYFADIEQEKKR